MAARRGAVVLALLVTTASAAVGQETASGSAGLADQLDETTRQLEDARSGVDAVEQQMGDVQVRLAESDQRLVALAARLREQETALGEATRVHADAAERSGEARERLEEVTGRLESTRRRLDSDRARFDDRVAAAYMYGGSLQMAEALLASEDLGDLVQTGYYVRSVLDDDKQLIDRVADETRVMAEQRRIADELADTLATREAVAERTRQEVERATEMQRELTAQVEAQREQHHAMLARLEGDLASYTQLVAAYEAESARLQQELARSRWDAAAPGAGGLVWPTDGQPGSAFGYRVHPIYGTRRLHSGVDIAAPSGQAIVAAAAGKVVSAGWRGGYGMAVVIDHGGGVATLYGHQSRLLVSAGDVVASGQPIGEVGSTGQSTGPHLHFEVREQGVPVDPMAWY